MYIRIKYNIYLSKFKISNKESLIMYSDQIMLMWLISYSVANVKFLNSIIFSSALNIKLPRDLGKTKQKAQLFSNHDRFTHPSDGSMQRRASCAVLVRIV